MFDFLKKKLKESIEKIAGSVKPVEEEKPAKKKEKVKKKEKIKAGKKKIEKPKEQIKEKKLEKKVEKEEVKPKEEKTEEKKEEKKPGFFEKAFGIFKPKKEPKPKEEPEKKEEKIGIFEKLTKAVTETRIDDKQLDTILEDLKMGLLEGDVAFDVSEKICADIKTKLLNKSVKRGKIEEIIVESFREALIEVLQQKDIDIFEIIKKANKEGRPAMFMFIGTNGSGKTTTIAKVADHLMKKNIRPVLAAGDTFRAASIEQIQIHADKLGVKLIKHNYGSDSAAVIYDAREYAKANKLDVVLADTAGRTHINTDLMDELTKVCKVNKPDLKILVLDSLTGNDAVDQAKDFDKAVDIDAIILTKTDVNEKGGAALSVAHSIGKPILFMGTGQKYDDVKKFDAEKFVDNLLE